MSEFCSETLTLSPETLERLGVLMRDADRATLEQLSELMEASS